MYHYSITQWLFFFYVYCFLGWCFESAYVSLKSRRPINRGFMRGPFLPIYGSGAIMMLVVSNPFQSLQSPWKYICTYIGGCLGATILEYVTGVLMESLFKVRYWDYSNQKFNFQGQICLSSSLAWGGLTLLMTYVLHKPVEQVVMVIPAVVLSGVTFLLTAMIGADFALSFKAALDLKDVLVKLEKAKEEMSLLQKRVDVLIALTNDDLSKKKEEVTEELPRLWEKYNAHQYYRDQLMKVRDAVQRDMLRSNPTMASRKFGSTLKEMQERLEKEIQERRSRYKTSQDEKK